MSGPKLSEAEIERLKKEQLERERQEALRRLIEARTTYTENCSMVRLLLANSKLVIEGIDSVYKNDIKAQFACAIAKINIPDINSSNPEDYKIGAKEIRDSYLKWKKDIDDIINVGITRCNNDRVISSSNMGFKQFSLVLDSDSTEIEPIRIDFSCKYEENALKEYLRKLIHHYKRRIEMNCAPELLSFDENAIKTIESMLNVSKFDIEHVKLSLQILFNEEEEEIRVWKKWKRTYDQYVALAMILSVTLSPMNTFKNLEMLEKEISELKQEYQRKDEMDYIADQINEVMIGMGYSFVTSRVLIKKDYGETEFSLYKEEGNAGVAVYTDQSGAVMMRMTVLGNSSDITDSDREFSYQNQIDFCSQHTDLVEALAKRGVYLKQKSYQAPSKEHTYKLNVSNHQNSSAGGQKDVLSQKVDRRARRRAGNKKMRTL